MRAQYRIRKAVPGDLERIQQIEAASFGRDAYDRNLFAYYLARCPQLFLVAERRGKVAAYMLSCVRTRRSVTGAELVSVAVDPASRQTGAASLLLESTLRRLRRRGVARLSLVVRVDNLPAQKFYRKYGFRRVRRVGRYYENGADGILMTRDV